MKNADMPAMPAEITINRNTEEVFPRQVEQNEYMTPGLTKREHFAGLVNPPHHDLSETLLCDNPNGYTINQYAQAVVAYKIMEADLLLEALEK